MKRIDLSISTLKANLLAPVIGFPIGGVLSAGFALVWGVDRVVSGFRTALLEMTGIAIALLVAGIMLHEILHGIGWTLAGGKGWGTVSFGFQLKTLTPYAHLEGPISARAYRIGTLVPGAVLGVVPWAIGMMMGSELLNVFGVAFTMLASGDLTVVWLLRQARPHRQVQDHPERVGVYLLVDDEA